jgi:hypothetical protein
MPRIPLQGGACDRWRVAPPRGGGDEWQQGRRRLGRGWRLPTARRAECPTRALGRDHCRVAVGGGEGGEPDDLDHAKPIFGTLTVKRVVDPDDHRSERALMGNWPECREGEVR